MIRVLSDIGRMVIVVAAILTVAGFTIGGYLLARSQELLAYGSFTISGGGQITPLEAFYSLLGAGLGIVVAGIVFGAIATLYDIRDSLRRIARQQTLPGESVDQSMATPLRPEPRV